MNAVNSLNMVSISREPDQLVIALLGAVLGHQASGLIDTRYSDRTVNVITRCGMVICWALCSGIRADA